MFHLAFDPVVENRGSAIGPQGADHDQVPCAHLPCAFGKGHDHVQVHRAERLFRACLFDGGAQATVGDVDTAVQLRQKLRRVADGVFKVRVLGQWPA
ncbi:hypothetical protein D9M73_198020 [compost metagenome]